MNAAVFVVRVLLGGLLIVTGALKLGHAPDLAAAIAGFRLLPAAAVGPLALALPFFEMLLGGLSRRSASSRAPPRSLRHGTVRHLCRQRSPRPSSVTSPPTADASARRTLPLRTGRTSHSISPRARQRIRRLWRTRNTRRRSETTLANESTLAHHHHRRSPSCSSQPARAAGTSSHPSKQLQNASQSPIVGKATLGGTAPQFAVATTSGLFDLSKTDKPVFLEIFATWCPHCQRETAVIDKLYEKYQSQMAFVGVSGSDTAMDGTSAASQNDLLAWVQKFDVKYPVAYDPLTAVADLYLQGGFPTIAVIDKPKENRLPQQRRNRLRRTSRRNRKSIALSLSRRDRSRRALRRLRFSAILSTAAVASARDDAGLIVRGEGVVRRRHDGRADFERDFLMRAQRDRAQVAGVWGAVDVGRDRAFCAGDAVVARGCPQMSNSMPSVYGPPAGASICGASMWMMPLASCV